MTITGKRVSDEQRSGRSSGSWDGCRRSAIVESGAKTISSEVERGAPAGGPTPAPVRSWLFRFLDSGPDVAEPDERGPTSTAVRTRLGAGGSSESNEQRSPTHRVLNLQCSTNRGKERSQRTKGRRSMLKRCQHESWGCKEPEAEGKQRR